jgi:hypothetical protein
MTWWISTATSHRDYVYDICHLSDVDEHQCFGDDGCQPIFISEGLIRCKITVNLIINPT